MIKWSVTEFLLISSKFLLIALTVGTVKYLHASSPILWLSFTEWSPELVHSFANTILDQKAMLLLAFLVQRQQFSDVPLTGFSVSQQIWDPGGGISFGDGCKFLRCVINLEQKQLSWFLI
jgi:hypothetical protein